MSTIMKRSRRANHDRIPPRDFLANAGLGSFLVLAGLIQLASIINALRDGGQVLALYTTLICLSSMIMAVLVLIRKPPVAKGEGLGPRLVAVIGSFAILPLGALPLTWAPQWLLALTAAVLILSYLWIVWALLSLRRSFSVFPEARTLVTHGPYALVRHPLYAAYFLTYTCSILPKISALSIVILVAGISAEIMRSRNEERVLASAFPEYTAYARRMPAFFPTRFVAGAFGRLPGARPAQLSPQEP